MKANSRFGYTASPSERNKVDALFDFVYGFPRWVDDELQNWARWCWTGESPYPKARDRCLSLEHLYVIYGDDRELDEKHQRIIPNTPAAEKVHAVWVSLPEVQRYALATEYPRKLDATRRGFGMIGAARKYGVSLAEYEQAIKGGMAKVKHSFEASL